MLKKVTIVIPNYNGKHFLKDCLDALEAQTYKDFETLVIDNASADGSAEFIRENYPWVDLRVMEENLGFSGGVNEGIKLTKTKYVILLNNDTAVDKNYVGELVKAAEKDKRIFSVSAKMVCMHDHDTMDDAGDLYSVLGWAAQRGVGQPVGDYDRPGFIFTACAGAALYRKSAFDRIGLFDLLHFAYLEDIDVGYRARLYGYTNVYAPKAVCYHVGSGTTGSKYNSFKVKLAARNSVYVNYKNMANWQLILNAPALAAGHLIKMAFFYKKGFLKDYVAGLKEGFATCRKCKRSVGESTFITQLAIEAMLIYGTAVYAFEFLKRRLK
ncbi:MAG: glycosyltransferase family 2 protein [Lachnospiraceae bacterium]|nr:glycosyltransferase family 2 protein [Lachnospiraceae bacterium]